jgi:hypothetical protein
MCCSGVLSGGYGAVDVGRMTGRSEGAVLTAAPRLDRLPRELDRMGGSSRCSTNGKVGLQLTRE